MKTTAFAFARVHSSSHGPLRWLLALPAGQSPVVGAGRAVGAIVSGSSPTRSPGGVIPFKTREQAGQRLTLPDHEV